jgi:hypothetical protein
MEKVVSINNYTEIRPEAKSFALYKNIVMKILAGMKKGELNVTLQAINCSSSSIYITISFSQEFI